MNTPKDVLRQLADEIAAAISDAEQWVESLDMHGQQWHARDGRSLVELAREAGAETRFPLDRVVVDFDGADGPEPGPGRVLARWPDGSMLVGYGDVWDVADRDGIMECGRVRVPLERWEGGDR